MSSNSKKPKKGTALITTSQIETNDGYAPRCPVCDARLGGITGACIEEGVDEPSGERAVPKPGSVTICAYCTTYLQFDEEMRLEQAPLDVIARLDPETKALMDGFAKRARERN